MSGDGGTAPGPGGATGRLIADRYRLGEKLGRGGMGTVWRAEDELLRRQVALKELHFADAGSAAQISQLHERTLREARSVALVRHPNVMVLHDAVEEDDRMWLVLELVDGRSLGDLIEAQGAVTAREAARIGVALAGALAAAHERGVLHRDLKPDNVLIEDGSGRVVLSDFGIAQVPGHTTLSNSRAFFGTPEYTAPERISGHSAPESDLWSLGVLLCAAVSGTTPFHRDSLAGVVQAVMADEIRPPAETAPLLPVVRGLLEREPERRMAGPEAARLLQDYLDHGVMEGAAEAVPYAATAAVSDAPAPQAPTPPLPGTEPPPPRRGRRAALAGVAVTLVAGAGVAVGMVLTEEEGTPAAKPPEGGPRTTPTTPDGKPTATKSTDSPKPSDSSPTTPKPSRTTPPPTEAPAGYRTVRDPSGFTLAVPEGFPRVPRPPRVFYNAPDGSFRIGIHSQKPHSEGPLSAMQDSHANGPKDLPGYRDASVRETTFRGHPAAIWTFTWSGDAPDFDPAQGPRRTYDLAWEQDGKMYDIWVSSPLSNQTTGKRHWETATDTFAAD